MKRLFDHDPASGTTEWFHYDETDGSVMIQTVQDVEDIVELNKAKRNATDERARFGEFTQVGSIPLWLYFKLKRDGVIDPDGDVKDHKQFARWLNDSDNRAWRTRSGWV